MELRPYQTAAVAQIRAAYREGARAPLYALATGGGKTAVFGYIAQQAGLKGTTVVILVHRRELLLQGSRSLREFQVAHGIVAAGFPSTSAHVRIASVQTLIRRLGKVDPPDLVIIDEAHHATAGSWRKVREAWPKARLLGVTATPARLDGRGLNEVFDRLILGPSMTDLVAGGYLVPCEVYAPPIVADLSNLHTVAGDYDRGEAADAMDRPQVVGDCVSHYRKLAPGEKAIVFCTTLVHAAHVAEAFNAGGIPAERIDGEMDTEERDAILSRFHAGTTLVLVSVDLVSEGFDCPDASVAILMRPTQSTTIYLQQVGRVMRPAEGKTRALVLDHVGNTENLGLPIAEREWTLEGRRRLRTDRAPPMARCLKCFSCFPPAPVCPMCGAEIPKKERKPIRHVPGDLELVQDRLERIAARREQGSARTLEDLIALGRRKGYKPQWAYMVYASRRRRA